MQEEANYSVEEVPEDSPVSSPVQAKPSSKNNDNDWTEINLASLCPEKLLKIKLNIKGTTFEALIDTGADSNVMKQSVVEHCNLTVDKTKAATFTGLGRKMTEAIGKTYLNVKYCSIQDEDAPFYVVPDHNLSSDVVLGSKFCKHNRLVIDLANRRLSKMNSDESRIDMYHDSNNDIKQIVYESVLAKAAASVNIPGNDTTMVPINLQIPYITPNNAELVFEGKCKNSRLKGVDGIIDSRSEDNIVLIQNISKEGRKVKEGDVIGRVSTLIEVEQPSNTEDVDLTQVEGKVQIGEAIKGEQRAAILQMLTRTREVFGKDSNDIGTLKVQPHQIELTDKTPIWQKPRHFTPPVNQEIERQCNELEALDIITKSNSAWSSPVVPVTKPDGSLRMCVDYRKLNKVTKRQNFPMPNLQDAVYSANKIQYFTKLDLIKGYYQLPVHEDSRQYTAFSTTQGHYEFKRLSFGLKNSGIEFQKQMTEILAEHDHRRVIVYIDDILILSNTFEEHMILVEKVLNTLLRYGVKINTKKCQFFTDTIEFLGHEISREGIRKSKDFVDKIKYYPKPKTVTQLRQFLGLCNFQRKFVGNFAEIAKPLTCLTGGPKRKALKWDDQMEIAFTTLKEKLTDEVALTFPDYSKESEPMDLFVDASGQGVGACLMQNQDGITKPIAYTSTAFNDTERRYSTTERELLAIRFGIKSFRTFLHGTKFTIHTDHKPLLHLQNMCKHNSKLMRIVYELEEYDYKICYRPGKDNEAADTLSRMMEKFRAKQEDSRLDYGLPPNIKIIEKVDGGGDSLFVSLLTVMEELDGIELPENIDKLREELVEYLLTNPSKCKMNISKDNRAYLRAMKSPGVLPCEEIILAACNIYKIRVMVHHGMMSPVVFQVSPTDFDHTIHLQCLAGMHYNPARTKGTKQEINVLEKYVNSCQQINDHVDGKTEPIQINEMLKHEINAIEETCTCGHVQGHFKTYVVSVGHVVFCGLVDTGAQGSVLTERVWSKMKEQDNTLELEPTDAVLKGLGNAKKHVIGIVKLKLNMVGVPLEEETPFAVVENESIPCCSILGANFIARNNLILDFHNLVITNNNEDFEYPIKFQTNGQGETFLGMINETSESESEASVNGSITSDGKTQDANARMDYLLADSNSHQLQDNDHAIQELIKMLKDGVPVKEWTQSCLRQYKRHHQQLTDEEGLLIYQNQGVLAAVVPFGFMTKVVCDLHKHCGHIGMEKIIDLVSKLYWHPALNKVARDVCSSCFHCQLFKPINRVVSPPMHKIQTDCPFQMVAVDLLQLPNTGRQLNTVLVAIDHFSKWLSVLPIKDKKGATVARALEERLLPNLPALPTRILSDNGPEFRSKEFNEVLKKFCIEHTYTTPYKPSSNGCVERSNRTIMNLLKGLIKENPQKWSEELPKAITIYNNTKHSELGRSPSEVILHDSHAERSTMPQRLTKQLTWKEGHTNYSPYEVGQLVLKRIKRLGNLLKDKLSPKFSGPYKVIERNGNGVTYKIALEQDNAPILKVHHEQLKIFKPTPDYLLEYLNQDKSAVIQGSESSSSSSEGGHGGAVKSTSGQDSSTSDTESHEVQKRNTCSLAQQLRRLEVPKTLNDSLLSRLAVMSPVSCMDGTNREHVEEKTKGVESNQEENAGMVTDRISDENSLVLQLEKSSSLGPLNSTQLNTVVPEVENLDGIEKLDKILEWTFDFSQVLLEKSVTSGEENVESPNVSPESNDWEGFTMENRHVNKLIMLRNHLDTCKKLSTSIKRGNNQIMRDAWRRNYLASEDRFCQNSSFSDSEVFSTPKGKLNLSKSPILTRARGQVRNLPNVQPRVLEYQTRKKSKTNTNTPQV